MILRDYQQRAVDDIRAAFRNGRRAPLLVLATGGGKTCIFSYIGKGASEKGNRVMILSHRQELIRQITRTLDDFNVPHGVIAASHPSTPFHLTQVASVQTVARRLDQIQPPDVLIIDEGHHSCAKSFQDIIAKYPRAKILGVTASPIRLDGRGLGSVFDCIIEGPSVQTLINQGFLARPVYYAPPIGIDTSQLHMQAGDFNKHEIEMLMDKPKITGDCVSHYTRICGGKTALVFCTSLKHCEHVTAQFKEVGYRAEMIDGKMDDRIRASRVAALNKGDIHLLVSCELLGEGFDCGIVAAGIMLRPTASLGLCLQQMGRVLRPAPGKDCAYIIDHCGNILRHGFAEDTREWSLDPANKRKRQSGATILNRQCPKCYCVHGLSPKCPQCGHIYEVKSREIDQVEGELTEITADNRAAVRAQWEVGSANSREALEVIARKRGHKPGWVDMILRARAVKEFAKRAEEAKQGKLAI